MSHLRRKCRVPPVSILRPGKATNLSPPYGPKRTSASLRQQAMRSPRRKRLVEGHQHTASRLCNGQ